MTLHSTTSLALGSTLDLGNTDGQISFILASVELFFMKLGPPPHHQHAHVTWVLQDRLEKAWTYPVIPVAGNPITLHPNIPIFSPCKDVWGSYKKQLMLAIPAIIQRTAVAIATFDLVPTTTYVGLKERNLSPFSSSHLVICIDQKTHHPPAVTLWSLCAVGQYKS